MCPQPDSQSRPVFNLPLPEGEISVYSFGLGNKVMITLHGFDDRGMSFQKWESTYSDEYTLYAPDLPFHGKSTWHKSLMNQADVVNIVNAILQRIERTDYTLVGHSFGARLILCSMPDFECPPQQVVLLAPGGIGMYDKVIPIWLQQLVEWSLKWPGWLRLAVKTGSKLGLVSKFHERYAEAQLYPPKQRWRLFRVFNSAKYFPTNTSRIKHFWNSTSIACLVIVAQKDRMVSSPLIKTFFSNISGVDVLEIIGSHDMINERVATIVKGHLENSNQHNG